ncbi:uncharacterized protein JCM6883_002645 [Sporobolomyces salmoneus]|uniref:uncharacterized protein n=1 Tax=Sporobolomyces salmoneus TaxID=183962 RepID=UPI00316C1AD5
MSSSLHPHDSRTSAAEEEDLLALLSSDTFSLESQRDRDLVKLGSFLSNIIPTPPAQPQPIPSSSSSSGNRQIPPHSYGSDHSTSSTSTNGGPPLPPAPSSSLNNNERSVPPFPMLDFSSFNGFGGWGKELEGFAGKDTTSFNQSRWNTVSGGNSRDHSGENTPMRRRSSVNHNNNGKEWRVPNCSRERNQIEEGSRDGTPIASRERSSASRGREEEGWKSRLRKSTVDQQQQHAVSTSRGYEEDDDGGGGGGMQDDEEDDLMMDD